MNLENLRYQLAILTQLYMYGRPSGNFRQTLAFWLILIQIQILKPFWMIFFPRAWLTFFH